MQDTRKNKELTPAQKRDYDFYMLQKRLGKKIKAKGLKTESPNDNVTSTTQKPKRGIMDNIGSIFECSYDMPSKPKRFFKI